MAKNDPWAKPAKSTRTPGKSSAGRGVVAGPDALKSVGRSPFAKPGERGKSAAALAKAPGQVKRAANIPAQAKTFPGEPGPSFTPKQLDQLRNVANALFGQNTATAAKTRRKV